MTTDSDRTRIRLEEVIDHVWALERALPDPLTLKPAISNLTTTLEAYERLEFDDIDLSEGDR
ncbi:hypothetical protein [Natrinema caseinilyticum]|uniref:hypothetical protein n=1 Tax=Natrinema caseinilyticum TaxID=2961570 RepID=UPI0020C54E30|nr:hypothetical protein [Natrinema caseinilyticum]